MFRNKCCICKTDITDKNIKKFIFNGYTYYMCIKCAIEKYSKEYMFPTKKSNIYHEIDGNKVTYFYENGTELFTQLNFRFEKATGWKKVEEEKKDVKMDQKVKDYVTPLFEKINNIVNLKIDDEIKNSVVTDDFSYDEYLSQIKFLKAQNDYDLIITKLKDMKSYKLPQEIYEEELTKVAADLIFYLIRTKNHET